MHIAILLGSTRNERQGIHVAKWITKRIEEQGHTATLIDPEAHPDAQILEVPRHYGPGRSEDLDAISETLEAADAFIAVTPEYNHSYSGAIKNLLDNFMPEYEKKAFGIASYSASPFGGVRANEALRPVISELKAVPTPKPLLISAVQDVFSDDGTLVDATYDKRLDVFLEDFLWYARALSTARQDT